MKNFVSLWKDVQRTAHNVDMGRVIVYPHIAYYVMVAAQFQYRYAAGVVAVILVAEVVHGHRHGGAHK